MFYPSSIFHQAAAAFRWCPGAQIFSRARLGPSETSGVFNCNENNVNTNHGRALQWLYHIHIYIYMYSVYIYIYAYALNWNESKDSKYDRIAVCVFLLALARLGVLQLCPVSLPLSRRTNGSWRGSLVTSPVLSLLIGQGGQELVLYDQNGRWGI